MQKISYSQLLIFTATGEEEGQQSPDKAPDLCLLLRSPRASTGTAQQIPFGESLLDQAQQGTKPAQTWKQQSSACTKLCLC